MAAHAKLSASGAKRWLACPGSVALSELYPQDFSTVYADEGTLAHAAAEQLITTGKITPALKKKIIKFYAENTLPGSFEQMVEDLTPYAEFVKEELAEQQAVDPGAQLMTERRVDLTAYIPGGFGTTDVAIVRDGFLHIIDLKYGRGVAVSAEGNPQLGLYALGTLDMLDMLYGIRDVRMTIYQPRLGNISTADTTAEALVHWGNYTVKPGAELALSKDAPYAAGDHCQFCPARNECRERAEHYARLKELRSKLLTPEEIGEILGEVDGLVKWASDVKDGALSRVLAGERIPGWKAVEGRSNRVFTSEEDEIVQKAQAAGYDRALLYESKLLTITAMEKLMGKKQFADVMGSCIGKPPGKPTLAPETDKRPAIAGSSAAEDFAGED